MKAAKLLLMAVPLVVLATSPGSARAQSSSSASFKVTSQTLNSGLGHSTSSSYLADQCLGIGPAVVGASTSASFKVLAGCVAALLQNVCGNGVLEVNEECDDGNTTDGDCCSSACLFETTQCRAAAGECDAAEICTGSSFPCPPDVAKPGGTPCTPDANPCTLDQCDGTSSACMHAPDNDNPVCQPAFTGGKPQPGDTVIKGHGNPGCMGGKITVFDCGPESPPVCFDGNDTMLGMGVKNVDGTFMITVPPLTLGQLIYIADSCTTPPLTSDPLFVVSPAPVPLLSPWAMALALAMLLGMAAIGVWRRRRMEG
jgi:cysteine-rich repeat protein